MNLFPLLRSNFAELRERGVVTTALAYLVIGYGVIEAAALLLPRIGVGEQAVQLVIALVVFGFPIALFASWAVRRDERRAEGQTLPLIFGFAVLLAISGWVGYRAVAATEANGEPARSQPLLVMMDSPHPSRVYDEETRRASGTNADVVNDILRDLPAQRVKETISPVWHRDEEIARLEADLILIHLSGFCTEKCEPERVRLRRFIEYIGQNERTRILIYSRGEQAWLERAAAEMLGDLPQRLPGIRDRIHLFSLSHNGRPHWKDPGTAAALKLEVKRILGLV